MVKNFTAALLACGLLLATAARAQDAGQDEVTLKNGGTIRGTVVSSEPGTSVKVIELGQTQPRVIPWSQVSDVEKGKYAPRTTAQPGPAGPGYGGPPYGAPPYGAPPYGAPPYGEPGYAGPPLPMPAMPPPPPPPPPARMGDPGVVRLHIDSPVPVTVIERRSGVVAGYGGYGLVVTDLHPVCTSPCDTVVNGGLGRVFALANEDYAAPPFNFWGMSGDVTMNVEPGSRGQRIGGAWAIVAGSIALATGAVMLPIALTTTTTDVHTGVEVATPQKGLRNAGIGLLAGGVVALGAGIALLVTGKTKLSIEPGSALPSASPPPPPPRPDARITPRYWMGEF